MHILLFSLKTNSYHKLCYRFGFCSDNEKLMTLSKLIIPISISLTYSSVPILHHHSSEIHQDHNLPVYKSNWIPSNSSL